jgi:hypothetical protein
MMTDEQQEEQEPTKQPISAPETENIAYARSRRPLKLRNRASRVVLVLLFVIGFFLSVVPLGRAITRGALLLPEVVTASEPGPLKLLNEPVQHTQTTVPSLGGTVYLDVYAPTTPAPPIPGAREGLLIIPGVGDNRREPQLINLSESLASAGMVVMNMTTPALLSYDLSRQDSDAVVQAFKALARWPGIGANRIGIFGISAGDALACFAAADPRIRDQVAFITLFGGYFNATSLLRDVGKRALTVDGRIQPWHPQDVPLQVLANVIADGLSPYDGSLLTKSFGPRWKPLTSDQLAQLSPEGAAAYHLLAGDEPDQVDTNLAAFSPQLHSLLNGLSPSQVIDKIHTTIYLLHDRNDQFVPFTESRDFAAALTRIHHPHEFAEFGIFQHVEVREGLGAGQLLGDASSLFRILSELLLVGS